MGKINFGHLFYKIKKPCLGLLRNPVDGL